MRGKIKYKLVLLILSLAVLLVSCGKGSDSSKSGDGESANRDLIVVGVSQIGSESMWRTANTNSVQQAFSTENGYYLIFDNARQKQENQIKALRSFISQKVDYIVFSPITEDGWDTVLAEAKAADIPVILMDRSVNVSDESLYTSWIGSDFNKEGVSAGKWLEEYLIANNRADEEINIIVLEGTKGATSAIGRSEGFLSVANNHSNWKIIESIDAEYTTAKSKEVMSRILKEHKDIDVVISQNDDMTFGAIETLEAAGYTTGKNGRVIMVSFDAVKRALELVEKGVINVDVECNPCQGEMIEKIVRQLHNGEKIEKAYYIEENVFTPENVAQYLPDRTY